MHFDALTMAAVADELRAHILGGRVQKVLLPDDLSMGMEVYAHGGRETPEATLRQAAQLAAYYSQARGSSHVDVAYTERRYVHRIKGAGPGLVTYTQEKTIRVVPQKG